jgi:hypothetical protein
MTEQGVRMSRKPQTLEDKYALIGIAVGLLVAAVVAISLAYEASSMVRYLIMASGLVGGWLVGRGIGRAKMKAG